MHDLRQAFKLLPDTAIITDVYWYILDFNRAYPFEALQRGERLLRYMPDCTATSDNRFLLDERVFERRTTRVIEHGVHVGYVVYLSEITEKERLLEERRKRSIELEELTCRQRQANEELEGYARQAEALSAQEERLRIARHIHDDAGHAITALHTLCQMCLQLKSCNQAEADRLLDEGIALCARALEMRKPREFSSLQEMLEALRNESTFPIELIIEGDEPAFVAPRYEAIRSLCKEAYHNTLSHSLAEKLSIEAKMTPKELILQVYDDGCFHGPFEKGFGLTAMENYVRASGGSLSFKAEEGSGFGITATWRA